MVSGSVNHNMRPAWFVNAQRQGLQDQTDRFVEEGIWESLSKDRDTQEVKDAVRRILPGDRIAIRSRYYRNEGFGFDNRGQKITSMTIRGTGTVKHNMNDGYLLKVDWEPLEQPREWYFYVPHRNVHPVSLDRANDRNAWQISGLLSFTFDNQKQDIDRFLAAKFGSPSPGPLPGDDNVRHDSEQPYTIDDIINAGCFLEQSELETMLQQLVARQNLILQGPPGTGKTWLAKKLAFALVGHKDEAKDQVRPLQFHPNLSYEDFVRGWRPYGGEVAAGLKLVDGPFLQMVEEARQDPDSKYVMVIEEINRGNPASVFGEMLTLLESDKRNEDEAMTLAYSQHGEEPFFIPDNVYVIGTMNIADRSLAMVDFAFRRRFTFIDLKPTFNDTWKHWVHVKSGIPLSSLEKVGGGLTELNETIAKDLNSGLGPNFGIGHSFVTEEKPISYSPSEWWRQIVETRIGPQLYEYWFDQPDTAEREKSKLLKVLTNS